VLLQDLAADGGHFIGGRPADRATVFIHGNIREGRPQQTKSRLLKALRAIWSSR